MTRHGARHPKDLLLETRLARKIQEILTAIIIMKIIFINSSNSTLIILMILIILDWADPWGAECKGRADIQ